MATSYSDLAYLVGDNGVEIHCRVDIDALDSTSWSDTILEATQHAQQRCARSTAATSTIVAPRERASVD